MAQAGRGQDGADPRPLIFLLRQWASQACPAPDAGRGQKDKCRPAGRLEAQAGSWLGMKLTPSLLCWANQVLWVTPRAECGATVSAHLGAGNGDSLQILVCEIPWTEAPGRLQSMEWQNRHE